ncbi:MAG TPA: hypothetical protein VLX28_14140 [Thermoanaerobaculia bacterium]|nr:hypothetical protein [Thermoanaerobaculia bacterium]
MVSKIFDDLVKIFPELLKIVRSKLQFYLAAILMDFLFLLLSQTLLLQQHRIYAWTGCFSFFVLLTLLPFYHFGKLHPSPSLPSLPCESLEGRDALYLKAATLLESATCVVDTTWGLEHKLPSKHEAKSRDKYLAAQEAAIRRGATYLEIFTTTTETQMNEMQTLANRFQRLSNFEIKVLPSSRINVPLMDFMVTNREHVLLSHISSNASLTCRYLYLRSTEVANLFLGLFDECWNEGTQVPANSLRKISRFEGVDRNSGGSEERCYLGGRGA